MVNLWTKGMDERDVSLTIKGGPLPDEGYTSEKSGETGESISLRLTPGHYTLRVSDRTDYTYMNLPIPPSSFQASIGVDISEFKSAKIEGKISIPESAEVMPVRMSVAAFDTLGNRVGINPLTGKPLILDPSKPVWVVVHGMNSNERKGNIDDVLQALYRQGNMQIVSIDWTQAAKDNTKTGLDVIWTDAVGEWIAHQLVGLSFKPQQINGLGHSHGTYVLNAMGKELMKPDASATMNTLIALDPAGNVPLWTGYDHTKINFSDVSMRSIAFESSFIVDSDFLAGTADIAFHINGPSENTVLGIDGLPQFGPIDSHSLGLTTMTEILNHEKQSPGDFSRFFSFEEMTTLSQTDIEQYEKNGYKGVFEGILDVDAEWKGQDDDIYLQGNPLNFRYKKTGTSLEQTIDFTTYA